MLYLSRYLKSPYHFSIFELISGDPSYHWILPKINLVSQQGDLAQLDIEGTRFFWPVEYQNKYLPWIYKEVFCESSENPHSYEYPPAYIRSGEWVIDGGAGEGFFISYALARGANVLAIEPVKRLCDALNKTYEKEISLNRVKILHGCLGEKEGITKININNQTILVTKTNCLGDDSVSVYSLDKIIADQIIPGIGFIKLDIEGNEISACLGGIETFKKFQPRLAIAVYHDLENGRKIKKIIKKANDNYHIRFRGIYRWEGCIPRPYLLFGN